MNDYKTVDGYINNFPIEVQDILQKIRATIQKLAPEAKEKISYGIPTFTLHGRNLVHFAAHDHHIGLYPGPVAIDNFADKLTNYQTSKGTIKFPINQEIPYKLVSQITKFCATKLNNQKVQ